MTAELKAALALVTVTLHDHLIVAGQDVVSFKTLGLLKTGLTPVLWPLSLAALAFGIAPDPGLALPAASTVDGVLEFITCLAGQFASAVAGLHEAGARLLHGLAGNFACLALNMRVARGSHQGPNDQSAEQHWTFP